MVRDFAAMTWREFDSKLAALMVSDTPIQRYFAPKKP